MFLLSWCRSLRSLLVLYLASAPCEEPRTPITATKSIAIGMRFRILTRPPLPTVKAWFSIPYTEYYDRETKTIRELKDEICSRIPALDEAKISGQDITLLVDEFELLDGDETNIIRDNDIVW